MVFTTTIVFLKVEYLLLYQLSLFHLVSFNPIDNDECIDERGLLKNSVIQKHQYELDYPLSSAVRQKYDIVYGYCNHAPFICKYHLAKKVMLFFGWR